VIRIGGPGEAGPFSGKIRAGRREKGCSAIATKEENLNSQGVIGLYGAPGFNARKKRGLVKADSELCIVPKDAEVGEVHSATLRRDLRGVNSKAPPQSSEDGERLQTTPIGEGPKKDWGGAARVSRPGPLNNGKPGKGETQRRCGP